MGDGDSKNFNHITNIYVTEYSIFNFECIDNVMKRTETRLRRLKASKKNEALANWKEAIDGRTVYRYTALPNSNLLWISQKAKCQWSKRYVPSCMDHLSSQIINKNPQQRFCPPGANSWLKYKQAEDKWKQRDLNIVTPFLC